MRNELPKHKKDLNPWAVGCYTSMVGIKQKHRLLENEIYSLEKMASAAFCQRLMKYPYEQINEALTDLMFAEFHDILPGSCIQPVAEASLRLLSHGLEIVSRLKAQAFFALSVGQKAAKAGEIPILVYNPHPFKVKQPVECEFSLPGANLSNTFTEVKVFRNGKPVPSQVEHELSNSNLDWRKMVVFDAELQPNQMNRFDCRTRVIPTKPAGLLKSRNGKIVFKTRQLDVVVNTRTGFVDRYRINGVECISKNAFEPIVMHDNADCWGQLSKSFSKVAGRFKLMSKEAGARFSGLEAGRVDSVRIIEDGPVRSVIEAVFSYGDSFICQRYKLPKSGTEIEVETRVYWNEKNRMLKLSVPTIGQGCKYLGQVAYGVGELPSDGKEAVAQKWVAVISKSRNLALTCINNGIYGSDFSRKGLRLTLLRSPAYACGPPMEQPTSSPFIDQGRFSPRIDQGERVFRFWFNAGKISQRLKLIDREALTKNEEPFALSFFPQGQGTKPKALAVLSDEVVQITTIKRAEKNNRLIIRLYEPTGKSRTTFLSLPCIRTKIKVDIGGFEIKTLKVNLKTGHIIETGLLERTNVK
jgi:alpha-mannosidase